MSRTMRADLDSTDTAANLEEGLAIGKVTIDKQRRAKSSTANFRAGRGGRASKTVVTKRFRGNPSKRKHGYVVGRK